VAKIRSNIQVERQKVTVLAMKYRMILKRRTLIAENGMSERVFARGRALRLYKP
jgi:hypothetical protein